MVPPWPRPAATRYDLASLMPLPAAIAAGAVSGHTVVPSMACCGFEPVASIHTDNMKMTHGPLPDEAAMPGPGRALLR